MVFSSVIFLLYFLPAFLLAYLLSPQKWKNFILLAGSCFFYAWGEPRFFLVLSLSLILDFYLVQLVAFSEGKLRKYLIRLVMLLNVGLLLAYKYLVFFQTTLNDLLSALHAEPLGLLSIALPVGISFVTFQKISYALDVYEGRTPPQQRFVDYAVYILMFPQLIAGPIIRYQEIAAQLRRRDQNETVDDKLLGFFRFILGLSKKVIIANPLGAFVDAVFQLPDSELSSGLAWLGIIAYSFQIYFDFSGYSDMAIGLGRVMGFRFPENFQFPYISQSITEFWRRWHITLSNWMRDYLYIPLGGNRVSGRRLYFNLMVVFLLSGLWHGAAWTFVIWGALHGLFLIADRVFLLKAVSVWGKVPRMLLTYFVVLIAWVFFRAESLAQAGSYLGRMFAFESRPHLLSPDARFWLVLVLAILFSFAGAFPKMERWVERRLETPYTLSGYTGAGLVSLMLTLICLTELYGSGFNPFIYFRF